LAQRASRFALGGTLVSSLFYPQSSHHIQSADTESGSANQETKEKSDDALARYTLWLTVFTGVLAIATIGLGIATVGLYVGAENQFRLARDEFLSTHRPKIRIKHLWLAEDIWGGQQITVNLGIVNRGTVEATLNTMGIRFVTVREGNPIPFDPDFPNIPGLNVAGQKLPVGVWWKISNIRNGTQLTNEDNTDTKQGRSKLYCLGYLSYLDGAKNMRITGFCRVLETPANVLARLENCRFRQFNDPDYEYED
jgi:hypothetical protein